LKNDFWISQGKVATVYMLSGQCTSCWCQILSGFNTPKIIQIS